MQPSTTRWLRSRSPALIGLEGRDERRRASARAPADDPEGDETVAVIEVVAARGIGEDEFTAWIAERLK